MKRFILVLFVLLIYSVHALQLTEIESNPPGVDSGNEWIELYSEQEINLTDYTFVNNDGKNLTINQIFQGYLVYKFDSQWLDNKDEKISIYNGTKLIFETSLFDDSKNNDLTYSFCNGNWIFQMSTPEKINCEEGIPPKENETRINISEGEDTSENLNVTQNPSEESENFVEETNPIRISQNYDEIPKIKEETVENMISLNPKTIKTKDGTMKVKTNYKKYSIIGFCLLLFALYKIKPKDKKNGRRKEDFSCDDC